MRTRNRKEIDYETGEFISQLGEKSKVFDPFCVHVIFTYITLRYDLLTSPSNFLRRRLHAFELLSSLNDLKDLD